MSRKISFVSYRMAKKSKINFSKEEVFSILQRNQLPEVEKSLEDLKRYLVSVYKEEEDPLAELFEVSPEEESVTAIPLLDTVLQNHCTELSVAALLNVFSLTLQDVHHNYRACLMVVGELILRKDVQAQTEIAKLFHKACRFYEPGHRYMTETVMDQLITVYFPRFESPALFQLLSRMSYDHLKLDWLDRLFVPALHRTNEKKWQKKILDLLFDYRKTFLPYTGVAYFDELLNEITGEASPELKKLIQNALEKSGEEDAFVKRMGNIGVENIPEVLELLPSMSPEMWSTYKGKISDALCRLSLPDQVINQALEVLLEKREDKQVVRILYYRWHDSGEYEKILTLCRDKLREDPERGLPIIQELMIRALEDGAAPETLGIYREFLSELGMKGNEVYQKEIQWLLATFLSRGEEDPEEYDPWFEKLEWLVNQSDGEIHINLGMFVSDMWDCASEEEYGRVKRVFNLGYPRIRETCDQYILSLTAVAAIELGDQELYEKVLREASSQPGIEEPLLAFNLACGGAVFKEKELLLNYTQKAIELGKTRQEFLHDSNFKAYQNDQEFIALLDRAGE